MSTVHVPSQARSRDRSLAARAASISATEVLGALTLVIAALAAVAATVGLAANGGDGSYIYETVRGERIEVYGRGIYEFDSIFKAAGNRATDLLTLLVAIPLLLLATNLAVRRRSPRWQLVLPGVLVYFLYLYGTLAVGTAHNALFLVYVALFSASLFAFILAFTAVDRTELTHRFPPAAPRRFAGWFMVVSGLVTAVVWLMPAELDGSTTLVTHALDLGVIAPAAVVGGALILRGNAVGYLVAFSLLVLEVLLAPMIALQTAFQLDAGVTFTPPEIIGPMGGFVTISLLAAFVLRSLLGNKKAGT